MQPSNANWHIGKWHTLYHTAIVYHLKSCDPGHRKRDRAHVDCVNLNNAEWTYISRRKKKKRYTLNTD